MLKQILLKNFKSYRDQALPLAPLTLMIGANASGKSNAIEAFRFLSWLAGGQKLSVIQQQVDDSDQLFRGSSKDLGYLGAQQFSLGCTLDSTIVNSDALFSRIEEATSLSFKIFTALGLRKNQPDDEEKFRKKEKLSTRFPLEKLMWESFNITLETRDTELHIIQEEITAPSSTKGKFPLYKIIRPSEDSDTDVQVAYNNFRAGGNKPQLTCTDQIALMCQLESPATFAYEHEKSRKEIPATVKYFQIFLEHTLILDPVPSQMRGDSLPEKKLRTNCSNISGVLYQLWQHKENQAVILNFIQSLPEQDIKSLNFVSGRPGRFFLELVESFGGKNKSWSVELLSDGTLRVLAIATAVLSAPEGSTVVIEEVDNGVHPSRASHLLTTMQLHAKRRNIRLLLTTHNPALMDALPDDALGDVVFCYRDPQEGDSRLVRLSDLPDYVELVVRGSLGDLVTNGIVDRFVKCPTTPEAQKQKALDWLARLQSETA